MDELTSPHTQESLYCQNCGIEVLDPPARCPLCGGVLVSVPRISKGQLYARETKEPKLRLPLSRSPGSRRVAASWIVVLTLLIPGFVSLLSDWLGNGSLTWSGVVALSLAGVGVPIVWAILLWPRRNIINISLWLWISFYLYALNGMIGGGPWARGLGIPITLLTGGLGTLGVYIAKAFKPGAFRTLGISLWLVSLGLGGIEFLIYQYMSYRAEILWSVITTAILVPLGIVFFVIHTLVQKSESARKFFHW